MSSPPMAVYSRRRGFTLAEVVCVLVIMTIIAAIALPRYAKTLSRYRADSAAARIVADLALAQRRARFSSSSQIVTFDTAADTYNLPSLLDPDRSTQKYQVRLGDEPYNADVVGVDFGGDAEISFDGFGQPDSGGSIVLSVGNCYKRIDVDSVTGDTTVTDTAAPPKVESLPVEIK